MGHNFNEANIDSYLCTSDSKITKVSKGFIKLTGYSVEELLGKSIRDVFIMLKVDSQILKDRICFNNSVYIFTKTLDTREVVISYYEDEDINERIYTFIEKPDSRFEDKFPVIQQLYLDNIYGIAIHSVPELLLLKSNGKYMDFQDFPYNQLEISIGRTFRERVNGFEGSDAEEVFKNIITTGESFYPNEFKYDHFKRGVTYWDSSLIPIKVDGKIKYIIETVSEVTERVKQRRIIEEQNNTILRQHQLLEEQNRIILKQKEQLEEQKKTLEVVIENLNDGILTFDDKGQYIFKNKAARDMFFPNAEYVCSVGDGVKQAEFYNINGEKMKPENIPSHRIIRGEKFKDSKMILKFPDKILHLDVSGIPIYDNKGNFKLGVVFSRDVSEDHKHEETLKNQYEFLDRMINNFDLPVVRLSFPDLKIVDINKKVYKIIDKVKPEIKSINQIKEMGLEEIFTKSQHFEFIKYVNEVIKEKKTNYTKNKVRLTNGKEIYWNVVFEPILKGNGEIQEILILLIDITAETNANMEMEKLLTQQEEFLANISHELKTPLNIIFSAVQLFNMYCQNGSLDSKKASIIKYIDSIKQNSYRLSKLINNIVDLSKIEAGFFELNLSNNNIVEVVEDIVMSITHFCENKGINIIFDTEMEEKIIACDPEKIERILLNLISNAVKFSDSGDEIFIELKDKMEFVEISVRDMGIGIDRSHLSIIFDRFKQVDKSLTRNVEGTGIGLSLVKSIVELHGGSISVESVYGAGSKFSILLPTKKVMQENLIIDSSLRNKSENIQIEFSDVCQ